MSTSLQLLAAVLLVVMTDIGVSAEPDRLDNYVDWGIYRGDKKGNQFSELAQINATNVHQLQPVWEYNTGGRGAADIDVLEPDYDWGSRLCLYAIARSRLHRCAYRQTGLVL